MLKTQKLLATFALALGMAFTVNVAQAQGLFDTLKNAISDALDTSKTKLANYQKTGDKQLVDHFYFISDDGKLHGLNREFLEQNSGFELRTATSFSLTFKRKMLSDSNMDSVSRTMRQYLYSTTDDIIGKRYIALAHSRGNSVKLYKPALGQIINSQLNQNFYLQPARNTVQWIGLDNVLIETAPNGGIVSVLTRSHQAVTTIGVDSYQYVNIYFGQTIRQLLENDVPNNQFTNNLIRTIEPGTKVEIKPASTDGQAQPASPVPVITVRPADSGTQASPAPSSTEQKLLQLKSLGELKEKGILTDEEFAVEKRKILGN